MQWFAIRLSIPRSARNSKIAHAQITSMVKLDFLIRAMVCYPPIHT